MTLLQFPVTKRMTKAQIEQQYKKQLGNQLSAILSKINTFIDVVKVISEYKQFEDSAVLLDLCDYAKLETDKFDELLSEYGL